ncbi:SRPBCC domain-containing protein [bacterium]|nr:SRPBCC domain-containing protein [bacterium]
MKCELKSDYPLTDSACKEATGRTIKQWHELLDAQGGPSVGRRNLGMFLATDHKVPDWWATTLVVEYEKLKSPPKKDGLHEGYFICVTKTINAPFDKLWEAWTEPAQLSRWFGAGSKADVRDGGSYCNSDGDQGNFLRVRENKDLRFSWDNPAFPHTSLVDVVPSDKGKGKSHVMLTHTRIQTREEADGLRRAWGEAFEKLKKLLEG